MTSTTTNITRSDIETLRVGARAAGDQNTVDLCDLALGRDETEATLAVLALLALLEAA